MGEVSEESGWVRGWCRQPLVLCCRLPSGQGQGRGATAVLVGRADQGSGAQAQLRAREGLPRLLAWLPVINRLAVPSCVCR